MTSAKLCEWAHQAAEEFLAGRATARSCVQALKYFTEGDDLAFAYSLSQFCDLIGANHSVLFRIDLGNTLDRREA